MKILALEFYVHQKYKMRLFLPLLLNTKYDNSFKILYLAFLDMNYFLAPQSITQAPFFAPYNLQCSQPWLIILITSGT